MCGYLKNQIKLTIFVMFYYVNLFIMKNFGILLKSKRKEKALTIAALFKLSNIDSALISKIENGDRIATRRQVEQLIICLQIEEKEAYSLWLKDKILIQLEGEEYGMEALIAAEEVVAYYSTQQMEVIDAYEPEITKLLIDADDLRSRWNANRPLNKTQLEKMKEYFHLNYTYESNRIEGNTMTVQETHLVVNEGVTISGKSMIEHLEVINHEEAIDYIVEIVQDNIAITERVIKELHYLILKGIDRSNAGVYRTVPVFISGSTHVPPQPYLLARQMEEYFEYYNEYKDRLHPIILAAQMHEKLVTIHPFIDGNGRTSRLVMNLILLKYGFTIANIKGDFDSRMEYYKALEDVQTKNDNNAFMKLVIDCSITSLNSHIELAG